MLGEDSLEVASTWLNLGSVLRAAGKLEEAEGACRQCLGIRERQLGSQHTDTAAAQIGEACCAPYVDKAAGQGAVLLSCGVEG